MKKAAIYNKADVKSWLNKAMDDILWAKSSFKNNFYSQTCFISQQAAEKSLKSLVFAIQKDFTPEKIKELRTHNLNRLTENVGRGGIKIPKKIKSYSEQLNEFYLPTRYPDIPDPIGNYTEEIAKGAIEKAEKIVRFVEKTLGD